MADRERKKRGPKPYLTLSEKKQKHAERNRKWRKSLINIGDQIERWESLRQNLGLSHIELAKILLDGYGKNPVKLEPRPSAPRGPGSADPPTLGMAPRIKKGKASRFSSKRKISGFLSNSPIQLPSPDENVWSGRQKEQPIVNLQTQVDDRQACSETESISNNESASENEESANVTPVACKNEGIIYDRSEDVDSMLNIGIDHNYSLLANADVDTNNLALETVPVHLLQPRLHNTLTNSEVGTCSTNVIPCNRNESLNTDCVSKGDGNSVDMRNDLYLKPGANFLETEHDSRSDCAEEHFYLGEDLNFSETESQVGVNGSPEPVQLQHGNIFLETEFDSGSESVKGIDDVENVGDFLKAHSQPGIEGPSENVYWETKIDSCSEDMNVPETELADEDEEISCDEDEFDTSDVSDISDDNSDVQQSVISENDAPRRSSRSCVQKAKKKIKRLAKRLRDKNEQRVDKNESEILKNEIKKDEAMNSENAQEKTCVDNLRKHKNKPGNHGIDEDYVPSDSYHRIKRGNKKNPKLVKFEKLDDGRFQCNSCEEVFATDENEEEHCAKRHKVFKCYVCEEHFPTKTLLKTHRAKECFMDDTFQCEFRSFSCEFCSFSCNVEQIFQDHLSKKHKNERDMKKRKKSTVKAKFEILDDGTFQCNYCQEIFDTNNDADEHCSKHLKKDKKLTSAEFVKLDNGTFQCNFCHDIFDTDEVEKEHCSKHLQKDKKLTSAEFVKLDNGTFQCNFCHDIFDTDEVEKEHCLKHLGIFKCPVCGDPFATESGVKTHQKYKCVEKNSQKTNIPFQCKLCSFSCALKRPFLNHMKKKHNDESYIDKRTKRLCDVCGLSFISDEALKEHPCTSKVKIWLCSICGEQIILRRHSTKRVHFLKHHEKNVKCCLETCKQMFHTQSLMLHHYRRCHGPSEELFICTYDQCGKKFRLSSTLNEHISMVHLKTLILKCDWPDCDKTFHKKWHLKVHTRIHKGETPIECKFCDYRCRQRASLKWHLRKHGIFNREEEMAALEKLENVQQITSETPDDES